MCLTCGCGEFDSDHGDPKHLTQQELEQAALAAGISPAECVRNIQSACVQLGWGCETGYGEETGYAERGMEEGQSAV